MGGAGTDQTTVPEFIASSLCLEANAECSGAHGRRAFDSSALAGGYSEVKQQQIAANLSLGLFAIGDIGFLGSASVARRSVRLRSY
jgi:hypothetical protein